MVSGAAPRPVEGTFGTVHALLTSSLPSGEAALVRMCRGTAPLSLLPISPDPMLNSW